MDGLPKIQAMGGNLVMVQRLIKELDAETARLKRPMIIKNAEVFPQQIHFGGASQIMKQLDVI